MRAIARRETGVNALMAHPTNLFGLTSLADRRRSDMSDIDFRYGLPHIEKIGKIEPMSIRAYNAPVSPTPATVDFAQRAIHELDRPGAAFALVDRTSGYELPLSDQFYNLLRRMLIDLAQNRPVALMPLDRELTPNQAADILN